MKDVKKQKKNNRLQRGFTLIETFVAIAVLLIAMSGPLVLVTKGLSISKMAKGQITAIYLAQEAIEYMRNVRDTNILNRRTWLTGLEECTNFGSKCKIDSPAQIVSSCSLSGCENLKYNSVSYLYGYTSGDISLFKREIEVNEITPDKELEIVVTMYWNEGPNNREFTIKERLLNWQ
ncbi:prepilin-type N-terminal cleavage/methylation domain-containing protein [Patescibacteria group bacterium]|nr:prepilin-type N-terminal cleavage/methylation domain-containing protein [Patescibacteria group bacterium]